LSAATFLFNNLCGYLGVCDSATKAHLIRHSTMHKSAFIEKPKPGTDLTPNSRQTLFALQLPLAGFKL